MERGSEGAVEVVEGLRVQSVLIVYFVVLDRTVYKFLNIEHDPILRLFTDSLGNLNNAVIKLLPQEHTLGNKIGKRNPKKLIITNKFPFLQLIINNH